MRPVVLSHHQAADDVGACGDESKEEGLNQGDLAAVADLHDVSVLHDVFFSFKAQQSFFFQRLLAAVFHEVVVVANFRSDEVFLQVGVNHACRALRIRAARDRPGAALFFTNSEERNQSEQTIRRANQPRRSRLRELVVREKRSKFFGRQFRHFGFQLSADDRAIQYWAEGSAESASL